MKKKIAHVKFTNCSWGPDDFVKCINKYSDNFEAELIYKSDSDGPYPEIPSFHAPTDEDILKIIKEKNYDFVHFHNNYVNVDNPQILHFHSPPNFYPEAIRNYPGDKLVVASIWAILPEYSDCTPMPTIIDIYDELKYPQVPNTNIRIRVGFSPSVMYPWPMGETGKGHEETIAVLKKLKEKNNNFEIDVINGVYITECLQRKSHCDILIDECVNRGYHKCSLEAMTLGKLTICSLDPTVEEIVKKTMNIDGMPFHNIWIKNLEAGIQTFIDKGKQYLKNEGMRMRKFMEEHWNPKKIVEMYEKIYFEKINN